MAIKKSHKVIGIVIALVVVLAIATATIAYFISPKATAPNPQETEVSLEQTPNYGSCQLISIEDIKNTQYGDLITNVSEGTRSGSNAPNGTVADSCGFQLTTAKSANNNFFVEVYDYTAVVDGEDKETVDSSWSEVSGSNPKAYFGRATDGQNTIYKLRVIPGGKNVMLELHQPNDQITLDEPSALDFLVGIAVKANFEVIDTASEEEVAN